MDFLRTISPVPPSPVASKTRQRTEAINRTVASFKTKPEIISLDHWKSLDNEKRYSLLITLGHLNLMTQAELKKLITNCNITSPPAKVYYLTEEYHKRPLPPLNHGGKSVKNQVIMDEPQETSCKPQNTPNIHSETIDPKKGHEGKTDKVPEVNNEYPQQQGNTYPSTSTVNQLSTGLEQGYNPKKGRPDKTLDMTQKEKTNLTNFSPSEQMVQMNRIPPPVYIQAPPKTDMTFTNLTNIITKAGVEIIKTTKHPGYYKVHAGNTGGYNTLIDILTKQEVDFTQVQSQKALQPIKILIKDLPTDTSKNDLWEELTRMGLKLEAENIQPFSTKKGIWPGIFKIVLPNTTENKQIMGLQYLFYMKIKIEYLRQPPHFLCDNCLRANHRTENCTKETRCKHCSGNHDVEECEHTQEPPLCANCQGCHRATSPECQLLQAIKMAKNRAKKKRISKKDNSKQYNAHFNKQATTQNQTWAKVVQNNIPGRDRTTKQLQQQRQSLSEQTNYTQKKYHAPPNQTRVSVDTKAIIQALIHTLQTLT